VTDITVNAKNGFFDKIHNDVFVDIFKQLVNRMKREIFFVDVPQVGTSFNMYFAVSGSPGTM